MKEFNFTKYDEAIKIYRDNNLMQALYDEGEIIMDQVLVCLHGEEHKKRRKVENKIFSRETFRLYETEIYPKTIRETIKPFIDSGKMDLVDFGFRVLLNLTADFSGVDRPLKSQEETETLIRLLKTFASGATLAHSTRDREEVKSEIRLALKEFEERFLGPSIERRKEIIKKSDEDNLPKDILTALLVNQDKLELPHDVLMREIAFYLLAGAQTSIHSLVHTFHEIMTWIEKNPNQRTKISDPIFIQKCVHESTRLHPSSPVAWRKPVCPVNLPNNEQAVEGDKVIIDLYNCNRDEEVFGDDAKEFNPDRKAPSGQNVYGLSFGLGMHSCIGKNLAAGVVPKEDTNPDNHHYGTVALIMRKLFENNAIPDPNDPPKMDEKTKRPNWGYYPIILNSDKV
ncbi:MAG: cytochrome P450 [Pseudomonadota bacterium]|nr:cytochrome P450 [Pseudomonadota bacterium]MEC9392113.1 cytochrome P450 [Pseudomonadota bacterium]